MVYCDNSPCETLAVALYRTQSGGVFHLCQTCLEAFELGQANGGTEPIRLTAEGEVDLEAVFDAVVDVLGVNEQQAIDELRVVGIPVEALFLYFASHDADLGPDITEQATRECAKWFRRLGLYSDEGE